jgi:hypothetical protein
MQPSTYDDDLLIRYLLGQSPEEEAARCDELSITDDDFAARLADAENDLVDAYVQSQLSQGELERFQAILRFSPSLREKVDFAKQFLQVVDGHSHRPLLVDVRERPRRWFEPSRTWRLGLAGAAAAALITVSSFLAVKNLELRKEVAQEQRNRSALELSIRELQAKANTRPSPAPPEESRMISFLLAPQLRGSGDIPQIRIPRGTERVILNLELEGDDFPGYRAALSDPASRAIVWRSENLKATSTAQGRIVSCPVPAGLPGHRNLMLELSGVRPGGALEFVAGYPFQLVLQ